VAWLICTGSFAAAAAGIVFTHFICLAKENGFAGTLPSCATS
jgi:hypothetical protein